MAAAARPSFGDAWWSLANLKTYRFSQNEIAHMRAEEANSAVTAKVIRSKRQLGVTNQGRQTGSSAGEAGGSEDGTAGEATAGR